MTDAAAINILSLSAGAQEQLLRQYFSSEGTLPLYRGDIALQPTKGRYKVRQLNNTNRYKKGNRNEEMLDSLGY